MKGLIARFLIPAAALLAGVSNGGNPEAVQHQEEVEYDVVNLFALGGTISRGNSINNRGWIAGYSNLTGNRARHATLWRNGSIVDLGTLGGPDRNSSVPWPVKNNNGMIVGISQTDTPEPLGQTWSCRIFFPGPNNTGFTCLGFVWEGGVMKELPTLGGHNGFATGANNRGQVVGWAENSVFDSTCEPPQRLQFRAVIWEPRNDQIQELPPLPGDTSGAATAINDKGQVVGISGTCDQAVGRFTAAHAVLWENGTVTDIGNLGGVAWNTPMAINQQGDIVGFSNVSAADGGVLNEQAFLWTRRDGVRPLRPLPGHVTSQATGINERRQVVGSSCPAAGVCSAVLWQDTVITDLNTVAPGYPIHLESAQDVNDRGQITGRAFNPDTNERPAFLATPVRRDR